MHAYEIIMKKRDGKELSKEEIEFFVENFTAGKIPDYQIAAFAMAVYFQAMGWRELADFTMAMVQSGDQIDLSGIPGIKVDKHSTGGVGDKTTILLVPWIAAAGAPIAKMSGRGLGHTGGTIDKLESIPGFNPNMSREEVIQAVNGIGAAIACQTGNLVPADKKLYAIRDVTGTVESIPLIASSVMSKKIAAGADAIVLDVKIGSGAFMKDLEKGRKLAKTMVKIGASLGRKTVAVLSNMDQPLGFAVGNSIEVIEAIETLKGNGPKDVCELAISLGAQVLALSEKVKSVEEGRQRMVDALESGAALAKLRELIENQGGNPDVIQHYELLPQASLEEEILAQQTGYVQAIDGQEVGIAIKGLGGGRETKDDVLDLSVGVMLKAKVGDFVEKGQSIATLYGNDGKKMAEAKERIVSAYRFGQKKVAPLPMVLDVVMKDEVVDA